MGQRGVAALSQKIQTTDYPLQTPQHKLSTLNSPLPTNTNDFEKVIFPHFPDLADLKATFLQNGAHQSLLTGSGSAVYGIFSEKETAKQCLKKIKKKCEFTFLGILF